jgi:MoxR-like ATPase
MTDAPRTVDREFAEELRRRIQRAESEIGRVVVGQSELVRGMLLSLICSGHVLIEGVPGLAKTTVVATLAKTLQADFCRLQFTPDLLPGDITGSEIYRPDEHRFEVQRGPIFSNLVLVDEINRAPAKVQSALLEAMQDRQVSIGGKTMPLPEPFMVLATQNPIDQQGTYTLPEAQMDRFLMKLLVDYPAAESERRMLRRAMTSGAEAVSIPPVLQASDLRDVGRAVQRVNFSEAIETYVLDLVRATRQAGSVSADVARYIRYGASPRGTLALATVARAAAFLDGQEHVVPEHVKNVCHDVLRHRVVLSYEALADEVSADEVLESLIERVPVP